MRLLSVCLLSLLLNGCATGTVALTDLDYSFRLLIATIEKTFPGGAMVQSSNNRAWMSPPFTIDNGHVGKTKGADTAQERAQAHAIILGDRRPYRVEIKVYIEERVKDSNSSTPHYRRVGYDRDLADELATRFDDILVKSRESRDLIDDFRAF